MFFFVQKSEADDIRPNDLIRRMFVTQNDLKSVNDMTIKFLKKPKSILGIDPNAPRLKFAQVFVESVDLQEK